MPAALQSLRQNQARCCNSLSIQFSTNSLPPTASRLPRNLALLCPNDAFNSRLRRSSSIRNLNTLKNHTWTPKACPKLVPRTECWNGHERPRHRGLQCYSSLANAVPESTTTDQKEEMPEDVRKTLEDGVDKLQPDDLTSWRRLFALMQDKHGTTGTWVCFEFLRESHQLHIILQDKASKLRESIVKSAAENNSRLETIVQVAIRLQAFSQTWPDLYPNTMHALLAKEDYESTIAWHERLSQHFPPGPEVLAGLFSSFVGEWNYDLFSTLSTIYMSSNERGLYDYLIPTLFECGASKLARNWRKKLVYNGDFPLSTRSKPFIQFLVRYYPTVELSEEELALLRGTSPKPPKGGPRPEHPPAKTHGDEFVAKWFATPWLSVEFAINFLRSVGVHTIGPRSLQALALREGSAPGVVSRIAQLEKSNIQVAPGSYCKALVFFAKSGEDRLLDKLLHTEVHPNDFDDANTRQTMMEDAAKAQDRGREELFQGVERALEEDKSTEPHQLETLLHQVLNKRRVGKAMVLLDRMEALHVSPDHGIANKLLKRAFWGVGQHPLRKKRGVKYGDPDPQLDRAIYVARRLSSHNFCMPLKNWAALLFSLGREGRFEELLQLSLEIVRFYKPPRGGLIAVRFQDTPAVSNKRKKPSKAHDDLYLEMSVTEDEPDFEDKPRKIGAAQKEKEQLKEFEQEQDGGIEFIPTDLPFTHRQHPIQRLFPPFLQRSIIRWCFDQTLQQEPKVLPKKKSSVPGLSDFDVAKGVRILARLRDQGVLINPQVIRSAIVQRMSIGQVSERRHRQRDSTDVGTEHVKRLVDEAWGSEILQDVAELNRLVQKTEEETQWRYPVLFRSTYSNTKKYNLHWDEIEI